MHNSVKSSTSTFYHFSIKEFLQEIKIEHLFTFVQALHVQFRQRPHDILNVVEVY